MQIINCGLKENNYDITLGKGFIKSIPKKICRDFNYKKVFVITDKNVQELYMDMLIEGFEALDIPTEFYAIEPGEKSKNLFELEQIYGALIQNNMTRKDLIIALGGGVVGDIAGFAAATYLRGIDFIQIPTSLLAQVDSSVGGKVAVNLPQGKNLVGNFYQPKAVYIDVDVLDTLPEREFKSGMAEVLKYAFIRDRGLYDSLMEQDMTSVKGIIVDVIKICVEIKAAVVARDEKEAGERMLLNFGHTFGHAIERYYNYSEVTHGEAIGHGMFMVLKGMHQLGLLEDETYEKGIALLEKYEMILTLDLDEDEILEHTIRDKKSEGAYINFILIEAIGNVYIEKLTLDKVKKLLEASC